MSCRTTDVTELQGRPLAVAPSGVGLAAALTEWSTRLDPAVGWAAPVGAVAALVVGIAVYGGDTTRAGAVRSASTLPNALTLFRGGLLAVLAAYLVVDPASVWVPTALYAGAVLLDQVDGRLARRFDAESDRGAVMDREFDVIGLAVGPLVAATTSGGPVWLAAMGLVRAPFLAHLWLRRRRGLTVGELPESRVRRPLAGVAMAGTVVVLSPTLGPAADRAVAAAVAGPFFLQYARDWLALVRPSETESDADTLTTGVTDR